MPLRGIFKRHTHTLSLSLYLSISFPKCLSSRLLKLNSFPLSQPQDMERFGCTRRRAVMETLGSPFQQKHINRLWSTVMDGSYSSLIWSGNQMESVCFHCMSLYHIFVAESKCISMASKGDFLVQSANPRSHHPSSSLRRHGVVQQLPFLGETHLRHPRTPPPSHIP